MPMIRLIIEEFHLFLARAMQQNLLNAFGQIRKRSADVEIIKIGQGLQHLEVIVAGPC